MAVRGGLFFGLSSVDKDDSSVLSGLDGCHARHRKQRLRYCDDGPYRADKGAGFQSR